MPNERHQARVEGISAEVLEILTGYRWPGNVRELRNVIDEHPEVAKRMLAETQRLLAENRARSPLRVKSSIPDVIHEQLRKLGYGD